MTVKKAIPLKAIAAMAKFESARESIRAFEKEHARLVEDYTQLKGAYNTSIDEVKEVYREHHEALGAHFGDFSLRYTIKIDAEELASIMGDTAVKMGILSYEPTVDRKKYDKVLSEGKLPADVIKAVEIHMPPSVVSPKKAE